MEAQNGATENNPGAVETHSEAVVVQVHSGALERSLGQLLEIPITLMRKVKGRIRICIKIKVDAVSASKSEAGSESPTLALIS